MCVPEQTADSKIDVWLITKCVFSVKRLKSGWRKIVLNDRPEGWTDERVATALIHFSDCGYSPFGGQWRLSCPCGLEFHVKVYID